MAGIAFLTKHRRWAIGVALLLFVVVLWVSSSTAIQYILKTQDFRRPFFLTYFSTSMFSLYLFGFLIFPEWRGSKPWPSSEDPSPSSSSHAPSSSPTPLNDSPHSRSDADNTQPPLRQHVDTIRDSNLVKLEDDAGKETEPLTKGSASEETPSAHFTWQQTAKIALLFCPLWFTANSTYNASLLFTSVSSSTILSSTSSFFTLVLGVVFGAEQFTFGKVAAILFCLSGVALVAVSDEEKGGTSPLLGDALALIGAFSYGAYTIFLAKKIPNERQVSMPMFFGFVGLFNIAIMWPFFIVLHFTGLEGFTLPDKWVLLSLSLNGLFGTVVSDLIWSLVIVFASPLVATLGLSLSIPLAMVSDAIMGKKGVFTLKYFLGSALVLLGFTTVNVTSKEREDALIAKAKAKVCGAHTALPQTL